MAPPLFSVVIVNYNYGRFLAQGLDSLLAQDFPEREREIIVVDDGSTDDSVVVVEGYKDKVRLLKQKNQRQAGAFKTGFQEARGRVLCLLDADDYCHPDKLKAFAERLDDPEVGIVQHHLRDVDVDGRPLNNPLPKWPPLFTLDDFLDGRCQNAATSGLAFRKSVLDKILPVPPDIFCWYDEYLIVQALCHAKMANINRVLSYHRMHGANNWAHRNDNPVQLRGHIEESVAFHRYLEPKLAQAGKDFTPRYKKLHEMETGKRRLLLAMHEGRRGEAFGLWKEVAGQYGRAGLGLFRSATLLLALIHPALYLKAYRLYSSDETFWRLRSLLLPDPKR